MKTKLLILSAIFTTCLVSCEKNMQWLNHDDPEADLSKISVMCEEKHAECGYIEQEFGGEIRKIFCGECQQEGYECKIYNRCGDIDECANHTLNNCYENADCHNLDMKLDGKPFECVCKKNYSGDDCTPDTRTIECVDLPENAEWNSVSEITQTWDGEDWEPSNQGTFNEETSETECRFKCVKDYIWNGTTCARLPECSATSETPCKDSTSGLTWSAKATSAMTWQEAIDYCSTLTEYGPSNWHLPTISELRTLIQNCPETQTGGSCSVTDSCLSNTECRYDACSGCSSDLSGKYSKFGDTGWVWSSSTTTSNPDNTDLAWHVDFSYGSVNNHYKTNHNDVRCVMSDSGDTDTDPTDTDTDPTDTDTDPTDTNIDPTTPCDPNPCSSIENSTGACTLSGSDYICGCNNGYFWNGSVCKKQITLGNICTGQNRCFNETEEIPCPTSSTADFYGQDAQYAKAGFCYPQSFTVKTVSGQNIVVDNNTGLEWQQTIPEDIFNWDDAVSHCESLEYAGYTDWRLPSPQEHLTIIDSSKYTPAINKTYFPMPNGDFWSSADHANPENSNTWKVDYNSGFVENVVNSNTLRVLCVRGNELKQSTFTTSTINSDVVVKDSVTGLIWQKIYVTDKTWEEALKYCKDLTYAGKSDWRLPNKNEITTLVNYDKVNPASDFPDIILDSPTSNWFKSSTTTASDFSTAWRLFVSNGAIRESESKSIVNNVRCVRSEKINDPCNPNPCNGLANSTQICTQHNAFEFSCGCNSGYFWDGEKCAVLPECSATSGTPCKDSTSHLTWSAKAEDTMDWQTAINYCSNHTEGGLSGWHLPNIDELRTILIANRVSADCQVREINNCLSYNSCWSCSTCTQEGTQKTSGTGCSDYGTSYDDGRYSKLGDIEYFWSSSTVSDITEDAWCSGFNTGGLYIPNKSNKYYVRCVISKSDSNLNTGDTSGNQALSGKIGATCTEDSQCTQTYGGDDGQIAMCLLESSDGFPDGYCTFLGIDSDHAACDSTDELFYNFGGNYGGSGLCLHKCTKPSDCRVGYRCSNKIQACLPNCKIDGYQCFLGVCDQTDGVCVKKD